jgi:SAM-dependent methyltransferase
MQYEPIKRSMGRLFSGSLFMRKLLYFLMDLLLLRTWHVKRALRKIRNELPADANILDAGSGMGQYSWRMSRMGRKWKITGVDINNEEVGNCNVFFRKAGLSERVNFRSADLTVAGEPESFDLILSVDVMEHILEDEKVFRNFHASLRNNGILLISTPSDQGGSDVHSKEDESFIGEHVRNGYGVEEIKSKLKGAGFNEVNVSYTYGKPGSISWLLSMKYPVKMLNLSKIFYLILPFYYLVVFPVSSILNIIDVRFKHRKGTGLLVDARKEQK